MDFHVERVAAPLRQRATESLRNAIAVGRFAPGQRLLERELCEMTGVSRTLVRESLRQLEAEGLIVVSANRGPVVVKLTRKQAQDIYDVRCLLEGFAAEIVAERGTDDQIARLGAAFEALRRDIDSPEPLDRLLAKNRFYEELIEAAANEALGSTLRMLNSRITLLRSASLQHPGRSARSIAELEALMDAIRRRDPKAAQAAATLHVRNAAQTALRNFPA
jgi:DNA-binding GntR family transcriptional regulator